MSDLTATNCCNNSCGCDGGGNNCLFLILILLYCGGGCGNLNGCGNGISSGFGGDGGCLWLNQ